MENLKENILKRYNDNVKKFIKDVLMKKGFIKTPNDDILKLNVFDNVFDVVNIERIVDIINDSIPNLWNIPPETQNAIINDCLMELLPVASISETENYIEYVDIKKMVINPKELDKKVADLLKANKKNKKAIFKGGYNSPEYQSQALINADVFVSKKTNGYYKFDSAENKFVKLSVDDVLSYVKKDYPNLTASKYDIMDYMKTDYLFFITDSDLPIVYNNNKSHLNLLDDYKADFDKVNEIVANFE
ncbi:hypothetical protein IKD56_00070 [bacterium]|nr:hypothetical protein [bacterium]